MKKLNTAYLANELGESAFFPAKKKTARPPVVAPADAHFSEAHSQTQPEPERPNGRTGVRPGGKRIITRHSFEVYEDQKDALRKLAYKSLDATGKIGSMSAMVREAIDTFLDTQALDA